MAWLVFTLKEEGETVTENDVKQAKKRLIGYKRYSFMQMIEPLSEFQLNFLRAIIAGVTKDFGLSEVRKEYNLGSYSNITRLKNSSLRTRLNRKTRNRMGYNRPYFAKWLKQKIMI